LNQSTTHQAQQIAECNLQCYGFRFPALLPLFPFHDGNDGNNHQQLDERESYVALGKEFSGTRVKAEKELVYRLVH